MIRFSLASSAFLEALIILITSSILSDAIINPSRICARSSAFFNSYFVLLTITSSNEKLVIQASRLLGTGGSKRIDSVYSSTLENSPAIYQTVLGRSARFEYLLPRIYPYISDVEKKTQIETAMEVINPGLSWKDQLKLVTISSEEKYLDLANLGREGKLLPSENL